MNIKKIKDVQFFLDYYTTVNYLSKLVPYNHRTMLSISRIEMKIDIPYGSRMVEYTYCLIGEDADNIDNYRMSNTVITDSQYNEMIEIFNSEQRATDRAIEIFKENYLSGKVGNDDCE